MSQYTPTIYQNPAPISYNPSIAYTFNWIPYTCEGKTQYAETVYEINIEDSQGVVFVPEGYTARGCFTSFEVAVNDTVIHYIKSPNIAVSCLSGTYLPLGLKVNCDFSQITLIEGSVLLTLCNSVYTVLYTGSVPLKFKADIKIKEFLKTEISVTGKNVIYQQLSVYNDRLFTLDNSNILTEITGLNCEFNSPVFQANHFAILDINTVSLLLTGSNVNFKDFTPTTKAVKVYDVNNTVTSLTGSNVNFKDFIPTTKAVKVYEDNNTVTSLTGSNVNFKDFIPTTKAIKEHEDSSLITLTVSGYSTDFIPPGGIWPPDTTPPVITLIGSVSINLLVGAAFTDPGADVIDNQDAPTVTLGSGIVNTGSVGTYTITYTATDTSGNAATPVTRTIIVS